MIQTLIKNWWLLLLRGLLALVFSVMTFLVQGSAETLTLREFAMQGMVVFLGMLVLIAGACTAAAGIWRASAGKWWALLADGAILSTAGLVLILANHFSFRTVTQIIVVLAAGVGVTEVAAAISIRRHIRDEWFLALAGVASFGFALVFVLLKPQEPKPMFTWLGSYSGFSALCLLALAFRLRSLRASVHKIAQGA